MRGQVPGGAPPFVGRTEVLARGHALLCASPPRGLVLVGPSGQGKTRLARELLHRVGAGPAGRPVPTALTVVATRAARTIPLGALLPLLPEATGRPDSFTDLVAGAMRTVAAHGGDQTPILMVDDAHLLDDASAAVVHQLASTGAAVPLLTMRSGESAPDAVLATWKEGFAERIEVEPMDDVDMALLATAMVGGELARATATELERASLGNPLVASELLRHALEEGSLVEEAGRWRSVQPLRPSSRLVEVVGARLAALPPDDRRLMELLAVGEPLDLRLLIGLVEGESVSRLERSGLVSVDGHFGRAEVRLTHPIYAEVVRNEMGLLGAITANRSLADAAAGAGDLLASDRVRAAVWRLDGGGHPDPSLLLQAARLAYFGRDDALAERLAEAALQAGAGLDALVLRAQAMTGRGAHAEAEALLEPVDLTDADDGQRAAVARCRSFALFWGSGRANDGLDVLAEAEKGLATAAWREEVRAERAVLTLLAGDVRAALAVAEPILAEPAHDRAYVTAAIAGVIGRTLRDDSASALVLADEALERHLVLGDQEALASPGMHLVGKALALQEAARLSDSLELCRQGLHLATEQAVSSGQAWFLLLSGRAELLLGRPATARDCFVDAAGTFTSIGEHGPRRWALAGATLAGSLLGDLPGSSATLAELDAAAPLAMRITEPDVSRARAWHLAASGHPRDALEHLRAAVAMARAMGASALAWAAGVDLARLGGASEAARVVDALDGDPKGPLGCLQAGHVGAIATGDADALESAATRWASVGAHLLAAEAAAAASAAWRRGGDRRRAAHSADRSAAWAHTCEGASTPGLLSADASAVLTPRERQVAQLAATGLSAKTIAERLGLARRTVENHLQRAYGKLAVRSRDELSAALVAPGVDRRGAR